MSTPTERAANELTGALPGLLPFIAAPFAHAVLTAALTDPDDPDALDLVLASHQIESQGMSYGSPDRCTCGGRTYPASYLATDPERYEDVLSRRARSFAAHQAAAVRAFLLGEEEDL